MACLDTVCTSTNSIALQAALRWGWIEGALMAETWGTPFLSPRKHDILSLRGNPAWAESV